MDTEYKKHWNDKFKSRSWGRYPPEDLVRFIGRHYFVHDERDQVRILEVGCGTGANLWFLHREGFSVAGIDGAPDGIEIAQSRLQLENTELNKIDPDLRVGDFSSLPWANEQFDAVIDIFAIYANTTAVIDSTLSEVYRVLKPGGKFYAKLWGTRTYGFGMGEQLEEHTFNAIPEGIFRDMGVTHFFDINEIKSRFRNFAIEAIDVTLRSDHAGQNETIEEFHCIFSK